jgi:hypothetical protein
VDCTTGTFEFEFSKRTGSAEVRGVQTVVRVREATITFDFRTRIAELRRYTRNAGSLYVPGPQLTLRLRVHRTYIAGMKVMALVVDGAPLRDTRRGNAKHDDGRCRGENLRHDQISFRLDGTHLGTNDRVTFYDWNDRLRGSGRVRVRQVFVNITPSPTFPRIITIDDRTAAGVEVGGRMFTGPLVATPHMIAVPTAAKMHPPRSDLQTLLAATRARPDQSHGLQMATPILPNDTMRKGHQLNPRT